VIAAVVCAFLFMGGFIRHDQVMGGAYGFARPGYMMDDRFGFGEYGPMMGGGTRFDGRIPMMRGFGFFTFFGRLIPLALLGLLVYGAYRFGLKKSNPQVSAVAAPSEAVVETSASDPVEGRTCRKCGGIVQEDWRNCPYCGTKQ
jgi:hypothetical protein